MTDTNTDTTTVESKVSSDPVNLADDLDRSIEALAEKVDFDDDPDTDTPLGIGPEQGLALIRPIIQQKATKDPDDVLKTLAVIHLETGALLDKHSTVDAENIA